MSWRELLNDAARHHFIGDFPSCPVADGTFFGLFTGQGDQLTGLLGGDLCRTPGTLLIAQSLRDRAIFQGYRLQAEPTHAPLAHRVHTGSQFSGALRVSFPVGCS